jgi:hypothetical protein
MRALCVTVFATLMFLLLFSVPASARDTDVMLNAKETAEGEMGEAVLFSIPFYMKGEKHPGVAKKLIEVSTTQSTRGAFRSDENSCDVAFLSCMKELQRKAQEAGGDAIIDIVSITRGTQTESPTDFRCVAGSIVVHVGLKAQVVKLE